MKPEITLADALALRRLKQRAPATWAASIQFHLITRQYCAADSDDLDLIDFAERAIKAMEQSG